MTLTSALNEAAGTTGLEAQGAANILAGTTGLSLVGALNVLAGNSYGGFKDLQGVVNQLNQTYGWGVDAASVSAGSWGAFDPASISGLTGWWDASDTGTITDTGGYVTQLNDLSGNANHLYQTGTYGPITGTRTQNGLNVLDFTPGNVSYLKHDAWTQTSQCTYFFVCQTDTLSVDTSTLRALIGWQNITNHQGSGIAMNTGSQLCMFAGTMVSGAGISANTPTQYTAVFDSASSHLDKDGVAGGAIDPGDDDFNGVGPLQIGDVWNYSGGGHGSYSVRWDGWLGELLIYEGVVGSTDRATIEEYLKAKWGTP